MSTTEVFENDLNEATARLAKGIKPREWVELFRDLFGLTLYLANRKFQIDCPVCDSYRSIVFRYNGIWSCSSGCERKAFNNFAGLGRAALAINANEFLAPGQVVRRIENYLLLRRQKESLPEEIGNIVLNFGKHQGQSLSAVSTSDPAYLKWLASKCDGCLPKDIRRPVREFFQMPVEPDSAQFLIKF